MMSCRINSCDIVLKNAIKLYHKLLKNSWVCFQNLRTWDVIGAEVAPWVQEGQSTLPRLFSSLCQRMKTWCRSRCNWKPWWSINSSPRKDFKDTWNFISYWSYPRWPLANILKMAFVKKGTQESDSVALQYQEKYFIVVDIMKHVW